MIYYTAAFSAKGQMLKYRYLKAKSFREAFNKCASEMYFYWHHILVVNRSKKARRYNVKKQCIKPEMRFFPVYAGMSAALLATDGKYSEMHRYASKEARDEAYQKCMTSTPAASASEDKEPSDITASSAETSASKSGLTSKKISNGSAISVTWMDALIRFSTAETSGEDSVESLVADAWSIGSARYRSRPKFATVKSGTMSGQKKLVGKTLKFEPYAGGYFGAGFMWKKEQLDFHRLHLIYDGKLDTGWEPCSDHYTHPIHGCTPAKSLTAEYEPLKGFEPPVEHAFEGKIVLAKVLPFKEGDVAEGIGFSAVQSMIKFIGRTMKFKEQKSPLSGKIYYRGITNDNPWNYAREWLEIEEPKTVNSTAMANPLLDQDVLADMKESLEKMEEE